MNFETQLPKMIAARFPAVSGFEIDHFANVLPVEYADGGYKKTEWPPVARWRVGGKRYAYALKPTFKVERWQLLCFGGTVRADYTTQEEALMKCLQWSSQGKEAAEINQLLGHRSEQPNVEFSGGAPLHGAASAGT